MIPRIGEPRLTGRTYRLRPGAYALLPRGGQLLVTHEAGSDENLQLPGGGIDAGESTLAALHREVMEETGWRIAGPRRLGAYRRFVFMPEYDLWAEKLCHIFIARPVRRVGPPTESHHTVFWIRAAAADDLLGGEGNRRFARRVSGFEFE